jgi:type IV pilus assembly protein PilV
VQDKSHGFSLIEVLVSLIVFSIGLLGLVSLQMTTLNYNTNAYLRTLAIFKAEDIADRMRANLTAVSNGDYNAPTSSGIQNLNCLGNDSGGQPNPSVSCTSTQMALHDIFEWKDSIQTELPNGQAAICLDSTPNDGTPASPACNGSGNNIYTVKIWWTENTDSITNASSQTTEFFHLSFEP